MRYKPGMFGRRVVWVALVAACAACAACADEAPPQRAQPRGPAVPVTPVTTGPTTLPTPPVDENIKVVLVSAGAEPRQALRYRPRIGSEHLVLFDNHTDMTMSSNGHLMFNRTFDTNTKASVRVSAVDGERITLEMTVLAMQLPNYDPTTLAPRADESIKNARGTFVITDRGKHVSSDFELIDENVEARDNLSISDYLVILPEEPVGVGAKWEIHTRLQRNGIGLTQIDTHELVALDATSVKLRATVAQDTWPQVVSGLAEDPLTIFELTTFSATGTAESALDLAIPVPAQNTFRFEFSTDMPIRRPEGTQNITLTFKSTMSARTESNGRRP